MKTITGNYKSSDGKDYFYIALNLKTKEYIQIKNAGCTATAETMAKEYFHVNLGLYENNEIKIFFHSTHEEICLSFIPIKYHRYFK
jgi:hypothetical protein